MSVKILESEVTCKEINSLKEMKENNLVFTDADWQACPRAAKAVISILILTVLSLIEDMEKMSARSSVIRELLAMFQSKLFCPSTEQYDKVMNKPEEEKQSEKEEPSAEVITPEIPADTGEKQKKKSWARRTAGFAGKVLSNLKELVFFRNEEDTKPISEDDPEYPKDSLGNPMIRTGTEETVTLRYIPAQIVKVKSIAQKFISSQKIDGKYEHKTIRGMFKGMFRGSCFSPEPGSLAEFAWMKFGLYMPVNRIVNEFKRQGINLMRGTMSSWLSKGSEILEKLMPLYLEKLFSGIILQADETVVVTQKHKNASKDEVPDVKNYVWVYLTPIYALQQAVIYDCGNLTRQITNAEKFLRGFKGFTCTDAYQSYLKLKSVIHAFCLIHARRKFVECIPASAGKTDPRVVEILNIFKSIFKFEESFKAMSTDQRKEEREKHIRPLMNKLKEMCEAIREDQSVSKKGKLSTAVNYFLNNWEEFNVFFMHGNIPLHNQASELEVKPLKLGLRSFLTFGSHKGVRTACLYLSVFRTAMKNGLDPVRYLSHVFTKSVQNKELLNNKEFLETLMPWNPEVMRLCADAEHFKNYNDPAWMEDYQRRVREEEKANEAFMPQINEALTQQNKDLEIRQDEIKKEANKKRKKTREANKLKKRQKKILIDSFNDNKSSLTSAVKEISVPGTDVHCNSAAYSIQLE